ncbi:hypothetical protein G7046_g8869 [Stylonectria norvegica]|nr:hypothetical protein G7046_g8869 [Stylonectria norvegica]
MSSPALLGAGASRSRSGFLTPSSEASLNRKDAQAAAAAAVFISPEPPKRKRADSVTMDHLLKPSVALKPHPPNLHIPPRVLQPLMVLPREHLPLSSIDFNASNSEFSHTRFFESHVKILDLETRMGSAPVVLLARHESSRAVYALERQHDGLYVACRLGHWIELDILARYATAICRERLRPTTRPQSQGRSASIAITTPQQYKDEKKKRAAIEAIQSLVRKRPRSQSVATLEEVVVQEDASDLIPAAAMQFPSPALEQDAFLEKQSASGATTPASRLASGPGPLYDETPHQQTAESIFDTIRTQYSEALYKSMGSLAYFAKGPLSRARSAFHLDLESNLVMGELIEFLKSLILTAVQIDKKYRETIPEVIAKMKNTIESSDEGRKKKRRARKMKLGKDGLYPYEEDHIRKWWIASKPEWKDGETNVAAQQAKSLASMLRTRETQLQIIVLLEILALEPSKATEDVEESQLPALPGAVECQGHMAPPPSKKRSKHNLPVLVDVHADRLTIWQSTASDEQILLEDSQVSRQSEDGLSQQLSSSEPLKDFCVDVIVPFFSARLPELCESINRKLGGPVTAKSSKSRTAKRSSTKREQKPGAATKRPGPAQPQRTLQRALSTDQLHRRSISRGPSNMIALMRSASSTSVTGIKREGSEPAVLKGVLRADPSLANKRSGSLSRSSSVSNLPDVKVNKKALVEAELKDAISALRKPNREVIQKAMAEAAQYRVPPVLPVKKVRKPPRSSIGSSIQVKATPANNRFKDMFAAHSGTVADVPFMSTEEDVIPPSSAPSKVPSTGFRRSHRDAFPDSMSPAMDTIGRTPTKPSSFTQRLASKETAIPLSSPLMDSRAISAEQLFVPGSARKEQRRVSSISPRDEGVFTTPVKALPKVSKDALVPQVQVTEKKMSIYQTLGWDDEIDDIV